MTREISHGPCSSPCEFSRQLSAVTSREPGAVRRGGKGCYLNLVGWRTAGGCGRRGRGRPHNKPKCFCAKED